MGLEKWTINFPKELDDAFECLFFLCGRHEQAGGGGAFTRVLGLMASLPVRTRKMDREGRQKPFILGYGLFLGAFAVSFREGRISWNDCFACKKRPSDHQKPPEIRNLNGCGEVSALWGYDNGREVCTAKGPQTDGQPYLKKEKKNCKPCFFHIYIDYIYIHMYPIIYTYIFIISCVFFLWAGGVVKMSIFLECRSRIGKNCLNRNPWSILHCGL